MYKGILNHKEDFIDTAVDSVVGWFQDINKQDITTTPTEQEWLLGAEYIVLIAHVNAMKSITEDYPFLKGLCDQTEADEKKFTDHEKSLFYFLSNSIANFMSAAEKDSKLKSDIRYLVFNLAIHMCRWMELNRARSEPEKLVFINEPKVDIEYNIEQTVEIIKQFLQKTEETEYDPALLNNNIPLKVMASSALVLWGADNFERMLNEEYERRVTVLMEEQKEFRNMGVCQYCGGSFKGLFKKVCSKCGSSKDY